MVSTFTPNIQLNEPARGDDVGTWDTPVNSNMTLLDLVAGGIATIGLNNTNVILSAAQFQSKGITFNSTLAGSVTITFPTSFIKSYEIQNLCTGSSASTITLQTTAAGGQVICCPPGEIVDVVNDGTNLKFKNLGRVGEYWDYCGSSLPNWVSGCSPQQPYLIANGTTFSSATYPVLTVLLGSTTLPDARGRVRAMLNLGTARLTGVITDSVGSAGGDQNLQAHTHANTFNDAQHAHSDGTSGLNFDGNASGWPNTGSNIAFGSNGATLNSFTGASITNASFGSGSGQNVQPTYMGGLTLIRAG